jgi:hypothetical protein
VIGTRENQPRKLVRMRSMAAVVVLCRVAKDVSK